MIVNDEIRNLKEGSLCNLVQILDTDEDWKKFTSLIPKDLQGQNFVQKYNSEHIRLIEEHSKNTNEKCAKILFDEWGTSGQVRPTLRTIMDIASKAGMLRAMDEVARLLGESPPPRPQTGPGAPVDTSISSLSNDSVLQAQTTAQMESAPDMIKFSTEYKGNDPTAPMQSETAPPVNTVSDMIKFPTQYQVNDPAPIQSESGCIMPLISHLTVTSYKDTNQSDEGNSAFVSNSQEQTSNASESHSQEQTNSANFQEETSSVSVGRFQESLPNVDLLHRETDEKLNISNRIDQSILQDTKLINFKYEELQDITSNFSETVQDGPQGLIGKIGQGGYGEVFVGSHPNYGLLAIKRIHHFVQLEEAVKTFNNEVNLLSQLRHENIVPIIGFSKDGPLCIICDYIDGGSLEMKLQQRVLSEKQRINIMQGTAYGLQYIHSIKLNSQLFNSSSGRSGHSASKTHLMHGDVKSANILLTKDFVPKLCDFGLAKQYDVTSFTLNLKGTRPYMAPEGFQGTITQKTDVYSFGIVLLELLTGLQCMVFTDHGEFDIKRYIIESLNKYGKTLPDLLDASAGVWTKANEIYSLICKCLAFERLDRPAMDEICEILHMINQ